jgi:hypothetical protein
MAKQASPPLVQLLAQVPAGELHAWLAASARAMPEFGKRLELFAARHGPEESALARYRSILGRLLRMRNRNVRKRASEAAQYLANLVDALEAEFAAGRMAVVLTVVGEALLVVNDFILTNRGAKDKLEPRMADLSALHLRAATEWRPDKEELAAALVEIGQRGALSGLFREAAYEYQDVLGEEGLAHYRRAMEPHWQAVESRSRMLWHRREQTVGQMLGWARAQEDPVGRATETARILAAVAESAAEYLQAAKSFLRANDEDAALTMARAGLERALRAALPDLALLDLAVLCMERVPREEALEIAWGVFRGYPDRESYSLLRQSAAACGAEVHYRALALAHLKERDLTRDWLTACAP